MNDIEVSSIDLVEGGNVFKQGHYLTLGYVPRDENGATVDLSGKTLKVSLWGYGGIAFESAATFSGGVIRFTLNETVPSGDYQVEFTATSSTDMNYRKKFPTNANAARISVNRSADDVGELGISIYTIEQFEKKQKAITDTFKASVDGKVLELETEFDAAVGAVTVDSEVVIARGAEPTLNQRLQRDNAVVAAQLADNTINVKNFSSLSVGEDWTESLKKAIDVANGRRIILPNDKVYRLGQIDVLKSIDIDAQGSTVIGTGNIIFNLSGDVDLVSLTHFNISFLNAIGDVNKKFYSSDEFNVKKLYIKDNDLGYSLVRHVNTKNTADSLIYIHRNRWITDDITNPNNAVLSLRLGTNDTSLKFGGWVTDNYIDLYRRPNFTIDVIKIHGGITGLTFQNNYIRNRNKDSDAEVDLFPGFHKARIINNHLFNVSLKRQQHLGGYLTIPNSVGSFDLIMGNTIELEEGAKQFFAIVARGSLFNICNNTIVAGGNKLQEFRAIYLENSDVVYDEFGTKDTTRAIISNNMADLRNANIESVFIKTNLANTNGYLLIQGNMLVGGKKFNNSYIPNSVIANNIWTDGWADASDGIATGKNTVAVGNIVDNQSTVKGTMGLNSMKVGFQFINTSALTSEIDASLSNKIMIQGGGTLTNIINGKQGHEITLYCDNARSFTIQHNDKIKLKGGVNILMGSYSIVTLLNVGTAWVELSRNI